MRNGTAPLNSSNSTFTALSVTGNSTIANLQVTKSTAANLSVSGASTFASSIVFASTAVNIGDSTNFAKNIYCSSLYIGGVAVTLYASPPVVKVTSSANQTISSAVWFSPIWDVETYDSTAMHSTASNSSRITFAGSTGVYHVGASLDISLPNQLETRSRIVVNDSTTIAAGQIHHSAAGNSTFVFHSLNADIRVADVTDYVTVQIFVADQSTHNANSTRAVTAFYAHQISTSGA